MLLQLCADSGLNHCHHHRHPWLIFVPGPSAPTFSHLFHCCLLPGAGARGCVWCAPAGSSSTAKNSQSTLPHGQRSAVRPWMWGKSIMSHGEVDQALTLTVFGIPAAQGLNHYNLIFHCYSLRSETLKVALYLGLDQNGLSHREQSHLDWKKCGLIAVISW